MISLLCQKSNSGIITKTKNKDLFNFLILGEPVKEPMELIKKESSFDDYFQTESSGLADLDNVDLDSRAESSYIRMNKVIELF